MSTIHEKLLSTIDANEIVIKQVSSELDRLNSENLRRSLEFNTLKARLEISNYHLFKFLDEIEGLLDNGHKFDSLEICQDYIEAAKYCQKHYSRTINRISVAEEWYKNYVPSDSITPDKDGAFKIIYNKWTDACTTIEQKDKELFEAGVKISEQAKTIEELKEVLILVRRHGLIEQDGYESLVKRVGEAIG